MKIFNWMQSKLSGRTGSNKPRGDSVNHHQIRQEPPKEEFSDWPNGLLAIGTFGNNNNNNLNEGEESLQQSHDAHQEDFPSSALELLEDFTPEEVGKLQKELTKLLSHKPVLSNEESDKSKGESSSRRNNLPLDKFLNCPSSLEVDRTNCTKFCDEQDDIDSSTIILSKSKDVCLDSNNNAASIKKRSASFLLKKMFACRCGFAPAPNLSPSLRDPLLPESRMEKILRAILYKKIYPQSSTPASMKKCLDNRHAVVAKKARNREDDDLAEKAKKDGSKWVKTDSEYIVLEI